MKTIIATIAILAAAVGFGDTERQANQSWVLHKIDEVVGTNTAALVANATNDTLQAAKDYTDEHGGAVKSVNGKDGEVVLTAEDVHALPDTYTPPPAPVQSVNGKTGSVQLGAADVGAVPSGESSSSFTLRTSSHFIGGSSTAFSNSGISHGPIPEREFDIGDVDYLAWDWLKFSGIGLGSWIYLNYVPTTRKVNGQPLTGDITIEEMTDNAAVLTNGALKTKGGTAINPQHIGAATPGQVQAVDDKADSALAQSAATREVVTTLVGQVNGSNVVIVVTNYLSGAYILDAAKLQIRELRDGQYRTVYNSRDEILLHLGAFETNKLNAAKAELRAEIAAVLAEMQHDAWGRRTSTGNPAPSNTIYTTEPSFVFGGGLEYERIAVGAGAVGILMDKCAPSYTAGDSGTFLFKDATGENYFGYSMTSGYAIGVPTDGIQVTGQRVTLTYNIVGSCPIVMWCPALFPGCAKDITGAGWYQLNDENGNPIEGAPFECAVDMESTPEVATVYIDTGANPTGFFSAWTSVPGKSSFKTNMPVDLNAANGGGVVSSDGHTVIVPQPDGTWRPANAN